MRTYLCCVARKVTRQMLSPIFEVKAESVNKALIELERKSGMLVNGVTNYADILGLEVENECSELINF